MDKNAKPTELMEEKRDELFQKVSVEEKVRAHFKTLFRRKRTRSSSENREARRGIAGTIPRSGERFAADEIALLAEYGVLK